MQLNRDQTILNLKNRVHFIAKSLSFKAPQYVRNNSLDDFIQAGWIGAVKAVDSFDRSKDRSLESYANLRIRGEILDFMRGQDHLSRGHRSLCKNGEIKSPSHIGLVVEIGGNSLPRTIKDERDDFRSIENKLTLLKLLKVVALPIRHLQALNGYYWDELPMKTIGKKMGVNESRISQLHSRSIAKIRECV